MSEIYRIATPEDVHELLDVTLRAYQPIRDLGIGFPAATADVELVTRNVTFNDCYLLEIDGSIAATLTVNQSEEIKQKMDHPFLWWFAVDPSFKGQGIGAKLMTWVEESIVRDTMKAAAVELATAERHPWLVPMYERRGYERYHEIDNGNGDGLIVFMRKILDADRFSAYLHERETVSNL